MDNEEKIRMVNNFVDTVVKPSFNDVKKILNTLEINDYDNEEQFKNDMSQPLYKACISGDCSLVMLLKSDVDNDSNYYINTYFLKDPSKGDFNFTLKEDYTPQDKNSFQNILENSIRFLYMM